MKKIIFLVIVFALVGAFLGIRSGSNNKIQNVIPKNIQVEAPVVKEEEVGIPTTISISSLNVNSVSIEQVGLAPDGRMAVPSNFVNTGWYSLGPKPGEIGNSVIAGHFDTPSGAPSVFWDLKTMQPGDEIQITDEGGKTRTFKVTENETFPDATFPLERVFGKTDRKMLNLITCSGAWDTGSRNYSDRVVVFSELEE